MARSDGRNINLTRPSIEDNCDAMRNAIKIGFLALSCIGFPALAQIAPQEHATTVSKPGLATKTSTIRASALVTNIDKATRTVTLKNATGKRFDVVAGDEVRNFNQIAVGDSVNVEYTKSVTLELHKMGSADSGGVGLATAAARAEPGQKPAGAIAGAVTIMAEVVAVDPEKKTITLRGPKGNTVELDVENPDHFRVVKKGDHVMATYSEAVAVSVEPTPKKSK